MAVLSKEDYQYLYDIYQSEGIAKVPHCVYLEQILQNPAAKTFYQYAGVSSETLASSDGETDAEEPVEPSDFYVSSPAEGVAYLHLSSFDTKLLDSDVPGLINFFKEIGDCNACIVDIRGNPGGSTLYWRRGIVEPNLCGKVSVSSIEMVRGKACKDYLQKDGVVLHPAARLDRAKYPDLNLTDFMRMQDYIESSESFQPLQDAPLFQGDFYVLIDEGVYSAAEAFAYFCKETRFSTLVGARTAGDGIGIDPLIFVLPNSGICYRFSASLGLNSDGASNEEYGTEPDVSCDAKDALKVCLKTIQEKAVA